MAPLEHSPNSQVLPTGHGQSVIFIGEGMANIVFSFPGATDELRGMLLRVPKQVTSDYAPIHKHWCEYIWPLFRPRDLVPQHLVSIGHDAESRDLVDRIRAALQKAEEAGKRKPRFAGSKIKDIFPDAMLISDMRPQTAGERMIEFKPKWLAQSPTAPDGAKRCRNCAREALRNNQKGKADPILCPLRFLDRDSSESMRLVKENLLLEGQGQPENAFPPGSIQAANLDLWLRSNGLVPRLRDAQTANDGAGVLAPPDAFRLGLAMTLRDCTCYVRISSEERAASADEIEARLGDLDLKNQETKLGYWRDMELELIRDGYYFAKEEPRQRTNCKLED